MSEKSFKKSEFKRTIDLGKTDRGQDTDLIRVWRESFGEEKAISLGDINAGLIGDYVPYTGAVDNVNLGEKGISVGYVKYDTTPTTTPTNQGTSYWDIDDNTLAIIMNGTTLKVGEDQYYPVKNQTGVLIPKGTAVRFAGTLGSSGRLLIAPFIADGSIPSTRFMGVTSEDIANGADGKVMWFGRIRGINTDAFNEGDILYASTTVAGGFQTTIPVAPNNIVQVCAVVNKSTTQGIIFVRPTLGSNINKDEGVKFTSPTTGDLLQLQSSGLWENKSTSSIILTQLLTGYTVGANTALADTDTILQAFGKVQGQIDARISGTIASGQVAFGTGVNTVGGSNNLIWDNVNGRLGVGTNAPTHPLHVITTVADIGILLESTTNPAFILRRASVNRLILTAGGNIGTVNGLGNGLNIQTDGTTRISILSGGNVGIGNITATNTLDVNGTARIRTISNLGVAATNVLVPDATGVVSLRTATQLLADMGGISGTIASGQVAFGTGANVIGGDNGLFWDNLNKRLGIGIASPTNPLQIAMTADNLGLLVSRTDNNYTKIYSDTNGSFIDIGRVASRNFYGLIFSVSTIEKWRLGAGSARNDADKLYLINASIGTVAAFDYITGNTGIGIDIPTDKLDVNGTTRVRTLANATGNFVTTSATGVLQQRTAAEVRSDLDLAGNFVTLNTTQTITGAKTFNNSLLVQSASNPVFRIATTDNIAIVNFRNNINEDAAGIEMSGPSTELAVVTRVSNYNIRIQPHGTGTIKLPNVPTGTGDVLGRDSSNNLVRLGSSVVESTGTFTPTLTASGGGITYTFTTTNASYVKVGSLVYFSVTLSSISSTGSGVNELLLGSLPFNSATGTGKFWYVGITAITGSSYSKDALFDLRGIIAPNDNKVSFNGIWSTWTAPTFTSGTISISGVYSTV